MSPGTKRRVPRESGKNLAREIAFRVVKISTSILDSEYVYEKQKIKQEPATICHYIEDISQEMDYISVSEGVERPRSSPEIVRMET